MGCAMSFQHNLGHSLQLLQLCCPHPVGYQTCQQGVDVKAPSSGGQLVGPFAQTSLQLTTRCRCRACYPVGGLSRSTWGGGRGRVYSPAARQVEGFAVCVGGGGRTLMWMGGLQGGSLLPACTLLESRQMIVGWTPADPWDMSSGGVGGGC